MNYTQFALLIDRLRFRAPYIATESLASFAIVHMQANLTSKDSAGLLDYVKGLYAAENGIDPANPAAVAAIVLPAPMLAKIEEINAVSRLFATETDYWMYRDWVRETLRSYGTDGTDISTALGRGPVLAKSALFTTRGSWLNNLLIWGGLADQNGLAFLFPQDSLPDRFTTATAEELAAKAQVIYKTMVTAQDMDPETAPERFRQLKAKLTAEPVHRDFAHVADALKTEILKALSGQRLMIVTQAAAVAKREREAEERRAITLRENKELDLKLQTHAVLHTLAARSRGVDQVAVYPGLEIPDVPIVTPYDPIPAEPRGRAGLRLSDTMVAFPLVCKLGTGTTKNLPAGVQQLLTDVKLIDKTTQSVKSTVEFAICLQTHPVAWQGQDLYLRPHPYLHPKAPGNDPSYVGQATDCAVALVGVGSKVGNIAMVSGLYTHYHPDGAGTRYSARQLKITGLENRYGTLSFYSVVLVNDPLGGGFQRAIITLHGLLNGRLVDDECQRILAESRYTPTFKLNDFCRRFNQFVPELANFVGGVPTLSAAQLNALRTSTVFVAEQVPKMPVAAQAMLSDAEQLARVSSSEGSSGGLTSAEELLIAKIKARYAPSHVRLGATLEQRNAAGIRQLQEYCQQQFVRENPGIPFQPTAAQTAQLKQYTDYCKSIDSPLPPAATLEAIRVWLAPYLRSPYHSTWRYLADVNPFIQPLAKYTVQRYEPHIRMYRVDRHHMDYDRERMQRSFAIAANVTEEAKELLLQLMFAAMDETAAVTDRATTIAGRIEAFCSGVRELNMAHNFDHGVTEADLLPLDRPTCSAGIRRRLLLTLVAHPLVHSMESDISDIMQHVKGRIVDFATDNFTKFMQTRFSAEDLVVVEKMLKILANQTGSITADDTWEDLLDGVGDADLGYPGGDHPRNDILRTKVIRCLQECNHYYSSQLRGFHLESARKYGAKYSEQSPTAGEVNNLFSQNAVEKTAASVIYPSFAACIEQYMTTLFASGANENGVEIPLWFKLIAGKLADLANARHKQIIVNVNVRRAKDGRTPLHIACAKHKPYEIHRLLIGGADSTITDYKGRTAFDLLTIEPVASEMLVTRVRNWFELERMRRQNALDKLCRGEFLPAPILPTVKSLINNITAGTITTRDFLASVDVYQDLFDAVFPFIPAGFMGALLKDKGVVAHINEELRGDFGSHLNQAIHALDFVKAKLLIKAGANLDYQSKGSGFSALHWAAYYINPNKLDKLGIIARLLAAGANPNLLDIPGKKYLDYNITSADMVAVTTRVRLAVEHGIENIDEELTNNFGSHLNQAIHELAFDKAKLLIQAGANLDYQSKGSRFTALHWAAHYKDSGDRRDEKHAIITLLCEAGANPFILDEVNNAPMRYFPEHEVLQRYNLRARLAAEYGIEDIDEELKNDFGSHLNQAIHELAFDKAKLLIQAGANLDYQSAVSGFTALHWAAHYKDSGGRRAEKQEIITMLCAAGANPHLKYTPGADGSPGKTAVEIFPEHEVLQMHGARVELANKYGIEDINEELKNLFGSHLSKAIHELDFAKAKLLIQAGANLDYQSKGSGFSALHWAVYYLNSGDKAREKVEIIALLLKAGAATDLLDESGKKAEDYSGWPAPVAAGDPLLAQYRGAARLWESQRPYLQQVAAQQKNKLKRR